MPTSAMKQDAFRERIADLEVHSGDGHRAPGQALLVLLAVRGVLHGSPRLRAHSHLEEEAQPLLEVFGPPMSGSRPDLPFQRLKDSGLWETEAPGIASTSAPNTAGGFPQSVYDLLADDYHLMKETVLNLLDLHFTKSTQPDLLEMLEVSELWDPASRFRTGFPTAARSGGGIPGDRPERIPEPVCRLRKRGVGWRKHPWAFSSPTFTGTPTEVNSAFPTPWPCAPCTRSCLTWEASRFRTTFVWKSRLGYALKIPGAVAGSCHPREAPSTYPRLRTTGPIPTIWPGTGVRSTGSRAGTAADRVAHPSAFITISKAAV